MPCKVTVPRNTAVGSGHGNAEQLLASPPAGTSATRVPGVRLPSVQAALQAVGMPGPPAVRVIPAAGGKRAVWFQTTACYMLVTCTCACAVL
jgi:hypothetical protein